MSDTIRILVVDDEPTIAEFLVMGLSYEGFDVKVATDGHTALELVTSWIPALVILDVMLPGLDGLTVCSRIRAISDVPVFMLTAKGELEDMVAGLNEGADDYLVKPFRFQELLARIRALLRRQRVLTNRLITAGPLSFHRDTREVWNEGQPVQLTAKEFDLLELFLTHPRQVFSREVIINRLWGYDYTGETNVVDVYVSHLRDKLGDTEHRLIQTVRGVGYVFRGTSQ